VAPEASDGVAFALLFATVAFAYRRLVVFGALVMQTTAVGPPPTEMADAPELDAGFHLLYELHPEEARAKFAVWRALHPDDPLGSAAEAATYLFEECDRQGVLTSDFFLDDKRLLGILPLKPDQRLGDAFFAAEMRAQELARHRLGIDPQDGNALFALTLSVGMQADYVGLIDRNRRESLGMIREADSLAQKLLHLNPGAADADLTLGAVNYVIGSLPAFTRLLLHFERIGGDKRLGIEQIETAAARGRYLRPFAKIILALVDLREKKAALARRQLMELVAEFPQNPLFARELAKLEASLGGATH
jgi:hypothetical protein